MRFQEKDETVTFYKGPGSLPNLLPSTGAHWGHLGTAMNNFYSSPNKVHVYTNTLHNLTILLLDLEKKMFKICMVLALWGPPAGPPWRSHILFEQL